MYYDDVCQWVKIPEEKPWLFCEEHKKKTRMEGQLLGMATLFFFFLTAYPQPLPAATVMAYISD